MGSTDRVFLHGLTTRTDGPSVVFFPPSARKACSEELVNRTKLHNHNCQRGPSRAVPLWRYWLWAVASPEFPLWRYCRWLR